MAENKNPTSEQNDLPDLPDLSFKGHVKNKRKEEKKIEIEIEKAKIKEEKAKTNKNAENILDESSEEDIKLNIEDIDEDQVSLNLKNLAQAEKFQQMSDMLIKDKSGELAEDFIDALTEFSKYANVDEKINKTEEMTDIMENMMLVKKLIDSEDDLLENYLNEKYEKNKKALEELENKAKEKDIPKGQFLNEEHKNLYESSLNPLIVKEQKLTTEEFYLSNVLNSEIINELKKEKSNEINPYVLAVKADIDSEKLIIKAKTKVDVKEDQNIYKSAVIAAFNKSFDSKLSSTLSTSKIVFNPVGFATGIVVKSAIGVFMQTEAGKDLSASASKKWDKVMNNGKKSKLGKGVMLGLVAASVIGATWAGYEDALPDSMQEIYNETITNNIKNLNVKSLAQSTWDGIKNLGSKPIELTETISNVTSEDLKGSSWLDGVRNKVNSMLPSATALAAEDTAELQPNVTSPYQDMSMDAIVDTKEPSIVPTNSDHLVVDTTVPVEVIPEFTTVKILPGGNLESIARAAMPKGTSYEDIQAFTLKIAQENNFADANKVPANFELKVPTSLDVSDVVKPSFNPTSVADLKTLDIPYGTQLSTSKLADTALELISKEHPDLDVKSLSSLKSSLLETLSTNKNGMIDTMKEPNIGKTLDAFLSKAEPVKDLVNKTQILTASAEQDLIDEIYSGTNIANVDNNDVVKRSGSKLKI